MSFPDISTEDKLRHFNNINGYIWRTISQLVQQVAYQLLTNSTDAASEKENEVFVVPQPSAKKTRYEDAILPKDRKGSVAHI